MKLGTINKIEIKLHFSTILIVGLVGFYAASFFLSLQPNASLTDLFLVGILNGIIILASILIHELCHSLMAQRYGLTVKEIELYLFGGVSKIEDEPVTPKSEFIISGIGPLSSLILGIAFLIAFNITGIITPPWLYVTLLYSGITNIGLGLFNLLPAFPMDGGRVLRAYLWNKRKNIISATKTASRIGSLIGYSLIIYGVIQIFFLGLFSGIWLILIGSFINTSARKSYIQTVNEVTLSQLNVKNIIGALNLRDVIGTLKLEIPFEILISDAIKNYFIPYKKTYFPVIRGNVITGIIHLDDVKKIPIEQRSNIIVGYAERPLSHFPTIYIEETGKDALRKLIEMKSFPRVIIVKEKEKDQIIGFISESDIYLALKFCELHPDLC
jgi:Zn-dependent protease